MKNRLRRSMVCFLAAAAMLAGLPQLSAIAQVLTQDVVTETREHATDAKQAITDAVYEQYIRDHLDTSYSTMDELKLVNALLVKQTLYDQRYVNSEDTIDGIMSGMEEGDPKEEQKFITQITTPVALYETSEDSAYYVAYANTMETDAQAKVQGYVFAINDTTGHVLEDCIYDRETGLAYIPKENCVNDRGEQIVMNVQIQFMQVIPFGNTTSDVVTSVEEGNTLTSVTSSSSEIFDVETVLQTKPDLDQEKMTVAVNGIPIQDKFYEYDEATGQITLTQSSAMIQSVSILTEEDTLVEKMADLFLPANEVYAITADQMTEVASDIELPDWVVTGTLLTGSAMYSYNERGTWTYTYGFGVDDEQKLAEMIQLIENGGALDLSKVQSQEKSIYNTIFVNLATNTLQYNGQTVEGLSRIPVLHLECAHASTALGETSNSEVGDGTWTLQPVRLRFLQVDRESGYAILGIYTVETHNQTGAGFLKIKIRESYCRANIGKKDAQTDETLAGAVYYVYNDANCTQRTLDKDGNYAVFTTIKEYPYSNTIYVKPGKYYVKEYQAPDGYILDSSVKILNAKLGVQNWADATGAGTGWNYNNEVIRLSVKKDSAIPEIIPLNSNQNPYGLAGALYGVYRTREDALNNTRLWKTLRTGSTGATTALEVPMGTYYVKELTPSMGYALCSGGFDDADADGIHEVQATEYGKLYTVRCYEPPLNHPFHFSITKWDSTTEEQKPQGTGTFAGAVFQVDYYNSKNGAYLTKPIRTWYYETNEDGMVYCDSLDDFVDHMTLSNGKEITSSDLFLDHSGEMIFPMGTYVIREIQAPPLYMVKGKMCFEDTLTEEYDPAEGVKLVIMDVNGVTGVYDYAHLKEAVPMQNLSLRVYDELCPGKIRIVKRDGSDQTPMEGVSYKMVNLSTGEEYQGETNEAGILEWSELQPDSYEIVEISTKEGKSLLKDPIEAQIPLVVSKEEAESKGMDLSGAIYSQKDDTYSFYELTFDVTDDDGLKMPHTGAEENRVIMKMVLSLGILMMGLFLYMRKERNYK